MSLRLFDSSILHDLTFRESVIEHIIHGVMSLAVRSLLPHYFTQR